MYKILELIIPSCARPEPVEGYLGALEDILQQVQNERGEPKEMR